MIDEDAFGILFSYFEVEDDEYGSDDRSEFVRRFCGFERGVLDVVRDLELPGHHHVLSLGHAVYVEVRDGDDGGPLLAKIRAASARLSDLGYVNVTVLAHGSRWVEPGEPPDLAFDAGPPQFLRGSRPSEPLRRALDVDALARADDDEPGWGPGVYVDTDALTAMNKSPKNAPTVLRARGARFFRIPALAPEAK